jgi:hypothetical protein
MGKVIYVPTPELLHSICEQIANGVSLRKVCAERGMPSVGLVCKWLSEDKAFSEQYTRARERQADGFFDEIVDIADTEEDPQKARVRIDARKWVAGKMRPKVYGEKLDLEHSGSLAVETIKRVIVDPGTSNTDS